VNKSELIDEIASKTGLSKADSKLALNAAFDGIKGALADGEKVSIDGFGIFEARERKARKGRNPQTGEEIEIAASKAPAFKAGKALKDACNA
jgi:DNA-binding protein HU-beta